MDGTLNLPDEVLVRILRLAKSFSEDNVRCVCKRWRQLLFDSYRYACLLRWDLDVEPALSALRSCRNVRDVTAWGHGAGRVCSLHELVRRLAREERLPHLTSLELAVDDEEIIDELPRFFAWATSLQTLTLNFYGQLFKSSFRDREELHASLEALNFGSLPHLEHLTLEYSWGYRRIGTSEPPSEGSLVPLSRTLVTHQEQQQVQPPAQLKTVHLRLSEVFQAQRLPSSLAALPHFSLTVSYGEDTYSHSRWNILHSLAAASSLQMLDLTTCGKRVGARQLATIAELQSLKELHLDFWDVRPPMPTRAFPRLERLHLKLSAQRLTFQFPRLFFSSTPNLLSLSLQSHSALPWPLLASLTRLTSLTIVADPYRQSTPAQWPEFFCNVSSLPALRRVGLETCSSLLRVKALFSLGNETAVTLSCRCRFLGLPDTIRSYAEYVKRGCHCLTLDLARRLFQDTRCQVAPDATE